MNKRIYAAVLWTGEVVRDCMISLVDSHGAELIIEPAGEVTYTVTKSHFVMRPNIVVTRGEAEDLIDRVKDKM